jgi:hypothetical protein
VTTALQEFDFRYVHIKGEDNVVADAFSKLCGHHLADEVAKTEMLTTALLISGESSGNLMAIVVNLSQQNQLLIQILKLK